jgi:hypothetical protein
VREVVGPAVDLTTDTYLLRRIEQRLAGANWQRSGGKGQKPKPVALPGEKAQNRPAKTAKQRGADAVMRLQNLGLVGGSRDSQGNHSAPKQQRQTVTVSEFWQAVRDIRGPDEQ